ncbi:MAG: bifunctional homocysteine S-methyltransferase/methylenetetrahydrofolate reductase [Spirochaetales bacterium]
MKKPIEDLLKRAPIIFDGAMGTELYNRNHFINVCFEELCISKPSVVRTIHEEYREAGCDVLTTNSFGANRYKLAEYLLSDKVGALAKASAELAREVAGRDLYVAGSVGPLGKIVGKEISEKDAILAFLEPIRGLIEGGVDFIIFETFSRSIELKAAALAAGELGVPYIGSLAFGERNISRSGESIEQFFASILELPHPPFMLSFNCAVGPKQMLEYLEDFLPNAPIPVLIMPNAGYPQQVHDRMIYMTTPEYFATYAKRFAEMGASALGGCCGTNPAHIKEVSRSIKAFFKKKIEVVSTSSTVQLQAPTPVEKRSALGAKLQAGDWITSVELTPPLGYDLSNLLAKAKTCKDAGVDCINIPDGPRASSRISPLVTSFRIQQEVGIEAVLHLTCRDKNIIGIQSELLGCASLGIHNLLIITGDPPKLGDYPQATAVFDLDSIGLTRIASRLNQGIDIGGKEVRPPTQFLIGVGADPTHLDQERELSRLAHKVEAGANFCITQPVYDVEALLRFLENIKTLPIKVIAGVWPLASLQNARFLNNEVPGVKIPDSIMERMAKATSKEEARAIGIDIAREIIMAIRPYVAGIQVSAPFGNVDTAIKVLFPLL